MIISEARKQDLEQLLELYTRLHDNVLPPMDEKLQTLWQKIISDPNHHVVIGLEGEKLISSCVLLIVPNLTHGQRPYALIENVITHPDYRKRGYGTRVLEYAKERAAKEGCYKIMLMTGAKQESTLRFYEKAGYNRLDKTAFVQWLE